MPTEISQIISSCKPIPCRSIYKIANLLVPPKKHSLISSKLWNEIVQDLYLTYNVFKYINYLSQFPYPNYIYPAILEFYDFNKNFQPYPFIPLLHAKKGSSLTVNEFNKLIDAILELANEANIQLQANLNKVHHDEVVSSSKFANIVYDVNQFLTFNYNQYFLLDCDGSKFVNLLNSISTFLTVLIAVLPGETTLEPTKVISADLSIPQNAYIKNLLIYCNSQILNVYGSIANLVLNSNLGLISLQNYGTVNFLILNKNLGFIAISDNSSVNILQVNRNFKNIEIFGNSYITTIQVQNNNADIGALGNATIETLQVNKNSGQIIVFENNVINIIQVKNNTQIINISGNSYVNTLQVNQNSGTIEIEGYAYVENLVCNENTGTINIAPTATVSNINCPSS